MKINNNIRRELEKFEAMQLAPYATFSNKSKGRDKKEPECPIRNCFRRDYDRILHSDAFQRLKKTQVITTSFLEDGDHYKNRMTHSLEVAQIGRCIATCLRLNSDLVEAAGIGHDLGHTPFGHLGEDVLNERFSFGFKHTTHSIRVVDKLERNGKGLNLTYEVKEAIENHSGISNNLEGVTLETKILPFADKIAYISSDIDDAVDYGIITLEQIPKEIRNYLGNNKSDIIESLVYDIINTSYGNPIVKMSDETFGYMSELRKWMFKNVYQSEQMNKEREKIVGIMNFLVDYYLQHPEEAPQLSKDADPIRNVCDYIAGMTDQFALSVYKQKSES